MHNKTCSLCGQKISDEKISKQQIIDENCYQFDADACLATFNRFQEVYGKGFPTELSVSI